MIKEVKSLFSSSKGLRELNLPKRFKKVAKSKASMQKTYETKFKHLEVFDSLKIKGLEDSKIKNYTGKGKRIARMYDINHIFNEVFSFLEESDDVEIQQSSLIYDASNGKVEPCQLEIGCNPDYGKILEPRFFWEIKLPREENLRYCPHCLIDSWLQSCSVEEIITE